MDQNTGQLGSLENVIFDGSCFGGTAVAVTDQVAGGAGTCCGQGSGSVVIIHMASQKKVGCNVSILTFCGDDVAGLYFDPASRNVFFADLDTQEIFIGRLNFAKGSDH